MAVASETGRKTAHSDHRRPGGDGASRPDGPRGRPPDGHRHSRRSVTTNGWSPTAAAGCAWWRSRARGAPFPPAPPWWARAWSVQTGTTKIRKLRKFVIELLLSNHPLDCPVCEAAGDCRLQDYAYEYEVENMLPGAGTRRTSATRNDHPNVARDPNRCINCGRCVRICREVMGIGCWGFTDRGYDTIIDTPYNMPLQEVGCVSCGQCISTCPVGALTMKRSRYAARHWQTEKTPTICSYCGVGCEVVAHTFREKLVRVTSRRGPRRQQRQPVRQGPLRPRLRQLARPAHDAHGPG